MKKEVLADNVRPKNYSLVTFKAMGNISEIMWAQKRNTEIKIKKIDKDYFVYLDTGEMCEFNHIKNRAEDMNSVRVSLGKLRDLLNTNIADVTHCRWVTLTYAENMTNPKKLYRDFGNFNTRLREIVGHYEYIVAREPQGRGAWHCHVVLIFDEKAPFIPNEVMYTAWKQGWVTVKKLDDVDNVGAYLTAYLGDMEVSEWIAEKNTGNWKLNITADNIVADGVNVIEKEFEDENGEKTKKKFVKGARLHMYPPKFNIYSASTNIKRPEKELMTNEDAEKRVIDATLTFERTVQLTDSEIDFNSLLNYRYYNSKRKAENKNYTANDGILQFLESRGAS